MNFKLSIILVDSFLMQLVIKPVTANTIRDFSIHSVPKEWNKPKIKRCEKRLI